MELSSYNFLHFLVWYFYINESRYNRRYDTEIIASSQNISAMTQHNVFFGYKNIRAQAKIKENMKVTQQIS